MFIEQATGKDFFSLQWSETSIRHAPLPETLRSAGAPLIQFIALSINIPPLMGRRHNVLLRFQVEFTWHKVQSSKF
jgi:hypothetical protein